MYKLLICSLSLSIFLCACSSSFENANKDIHKRANYDATNIVNLNNRTVLLNYDYLAIFEDFQKFLLEFMYVKNPCLIFDVTNEKAILYTNLARKSGFRAYLSDNFDNNNVDTYINVSFLENKNKTKLLVKMVSDEFTLQRLYERESKDTYAISNFSLLELS